ncbi:uncharacterized protein [Montipora capricornis]|uniref:uncharacterized protein isoform X2 n=1 Tax=Montipora capricornis TaxID=246305 RepID=UPI0035F212B1
MNLQKRIVRNQIFVGTTALYLWVHLSYTNTNGNAGACRTLQFIPAILGKALKNHVIKNITLDESDICRIKCYLDEDCLSFNFGHSVCQLSDSDYKQHPEDLKESDGFIYVGTENDCYGNLCSSHGKCAINAIDNTHYCKCEKGYTGKHCEDLVTGCSKVPNPRVSGIYNIRLNDSFGHFPVYCDQTSDEGGWTMVFKVVANATPLYVAEMWKSRNTTSENVTAALDTSSTFNGHYKNRLVLSHNWNTFNPKQVRVALYKDGQEVQSLKFNAVNDNVEWFTKENLNFSTWDDLKSNSSLKYFELQPIIEKAQDTRRSFEISEKYDGCKNDVGWLMISTDTNPCAFERKNPLSILYSKEKNSSVYNSEDMDLADVFAVFIR